MTYRGIEVQIEHEIEDGPDAIISRTDGKPFVLDGWPHMEIVVDESELQEDQR